MKTYKIINEKGEVEIVLDEKTFNLNEEIDLMLHLSEKGRHTRSEETKQRIINKINDLL